MVVAGSTVRVDSSKSTVWCDDVRPYFLDDDKALGGTAFLLFLLLLLADCEAAPRKRNKPNFAMMMREE